MHALAPRSLGPHQQGAPLARGKGDTGQLLRFVFGGQRELEHGGIRATAGRSIQRQYRHRGVRRRKDVIDLPLVQRADHQRRAALPRRPVALGRTGKTTAVQHVHGNTAIGVGIPGGQKAAHQRIPGSRQRSGQGQQQRELPGERISPRGLLQGAGQGSRRVPGISGQPGGQFFRALRGALDTAQGGQVDPPRECSHLARLQDCAGLGIQVLRGGPERIQAGRG